MFMKERIYPGVVAASAIIGYFAHMVWITKAVMPMLDTDSFARGYFAMVLCIGLIGVIAVMIVIGIAKVSIEWYRDQFSELDKEATCEEQENR